MKTIREFIRSKVGTAALFAASAALILTGTVGGARAAIPPYTASDYLAEIGVHEVGDVVVTRGDEIVGEEDLLNNVDEVGLIPGKVYAEPLAVTNNSNAPAYVRVTLTKAWVVDDEVDTRLNPELIELKLADGWIKDSRTFSDETVVLYWPEPLGSDDDPVQFLESVRISDEIPVLVTQERTETESGTKIDTTFDYQGATLSLKAEVDAVQTHNAEDAIVSAWGVTPSMSGTTITGIE